MTHRDGEERALTVPIALFTTSISMARRVGLGGVGPVGLPEVSARDLLASGALVEVLSGWTLAPVDLTALHADGRKLSLRARAFVDLLKMSFA